MHKLCSSLLALCALLLTLPTAAAQHHRSVEQSRWLWVKDYYSQLGIAGATVDIALGDKCLGQTEYAAVKWKAHYTTNGAGRVLVRNLPEKLSCRVTVNGHQLDVFTYGGSLRIDDNRFPAWAQLHAYTTTIWTMPEADKNRTAPPDWWYTDDPTLFRSYIQDPHSAELISNVKVTALPSGITTTSDGNGLFTLEIPASYRHGKFPAMATQTLVFSKTGYKTLEYRKLVLHPGLVSLDILLPKGTGTLVRRNGSIYAGNVYEDEFAAYSGKAPEHPPAGRGEIISVQIEPFTYDGGWINCSKGAKLVVKTRNVKSVGMGWTPTGTGVTESVDGGRAKKVSTSPDGDTWELPLSDVMSTHFAVGATANDGRVVGSMDLGNVGCE